MKQVPAMLVSAIVAGLPLILFSYRGANPNDVSAQILSWLSMGALVALGLGMVALRTIWDGFSENDQVTLALVVAFAAYGITAIACFAMWVFPLSAFLVYVLITMTTYAFVQPFVDRWREPK